MVALKELTLALSFLASPNDPLSDTDGWEKYVWRVPDAKACVMQDDGFCQVLRDRWDFKQDQFFTFGFRLDREKNRIISKITLSNQDPTDIDEVCIVAMFYREDGNQIGVTFAHLKSFPDRSFSREFPIAPKAKVDQVRSISIGSKSCDRSANTNDARNFVRLREIIGQR